MPLHKHLIIRAEVEQPFVNVDETEAWLFALANEIGMNITKHGGPHVDYVEKEGNCGIAGMVMIETSHISIHCWDKEDPPLVQMDVYSCAEYDEGVVLAFLSELEPTDVQWMLIDRKDDLKVILPKEEEPQNPVMPQIDPLGLSY